MRLLRSALALAAALVSVTQAQGQDRGRAQAPTAAQVHDGERLRLNLGPLRPGATSDRGKPNSSNTEESKVGTFGLPPLFTSSAPPSPDQWMKRREELARLVEDNWVGRIPPSVASFRVVWRKEPVPAPRGQSAEHWIGQVIAADGRSGPMVDATITFPAIAEHVPALIEYAYMWPPGFNLAALTGNGPRPPDPVQTALRHGFAYVAYRPQLLQADNGGQMQDGVIGLARWPRESTDWGALRAWGWGASQLREELARDPRINGSRISLAGHSRFGKAVLVAAAFDPAFADADVSSSGAGGAKLMRRDFGERWENMASSGAFHWFTPNVMTYAVAGRSTSDLPIDAHTLIALRAPRPLFVTSGMASKGDGWVDPAGMWQAVRAAQPAWALFGSVVPDDAMPQPGKLDDTPYKLGWYQHTEGHVAWPGNEAFYAHEARFAAPRNTVRYRDPVRSHRPRRGLA